MDVRNQPALVGIVPRKELWTVIQEQQWYHIPVQSAPRNVLHVEYIAFYFPSVFGEKLKYQVIYYAPVTRITVAKRIQLFPGEPRHPRRDADYYQFHLGAINELPHAIPSKRWRRIIHIPTSFQKLMTAEEINDLYDTSPLEEKMYEALKRRDIDAERQLCVYADSQAYFLDFAIFCRRANIDLECDGERYHNLPDAFTKDRIRNNQLTSFGWHVLRFAGKEINRKLAGCLALIEKTIATLGGLKIINHSNLAG